MRSSAPSHPEPVRPRFERRRREILDTASEQVNALGVRGMTLTGVARALGLDPSSVTYYFRKKDDLAFACLERSLVWMHEQATRAAAAGDPAAVMRTFVQAHLALYRANPSASTPKLALLSDMHAISGAAKQTLSALYSRTERALRPALGIADPARALVASLSLLATVHWIPAWIGAYEQDDLPRIGARLADLLENGLGLELPNEEVPFPDEPGGDDAQGRFLLAATALINRDGYHGASVEKIAAELGVSIGSFYHHLETKDELVLACFDRSFALIARARDIGEGVGDSHGAQLGRTFASLIRLQTQGASPLLRTSAYQALPPELRRRMLRRTAQSTLHLAGRINDGIIQGSIRRVDALLAGQFFVCLINAAADLRDWADARAIPTIAPAFLSILRNGLFNDTHRTPEPSA